MLISYVLRLRSDALAEGRFVGEIEAVMSRQRQRIHDLSQVAAFVHATMPVQLASKETAWELAFDADWALGNAPISGADAGALQSAPLPPEVRGSSGELR